MAWDKTKPVGTDIVDTVDNSIRANNDAIETALGADHDFTTGSTQTGLHKQVTLTPPRATPAAGVANTGHLYGKDVAAKIELHWHDEDHNEKALTNVGKINNAWADMFGVYKDEDDMASDSAIHFPTQQSVKAHVASGAVTMINKTLTSPVINTGVSGTAIDTDTALAANSDTLLASQKATKAYVDAGISGCVLQVVNTTYTTAQTCTTVIPLDNTIPQNTEGDEVMTATITPKNANNKLRIDVVVQISRNAVGQHIAALFQDATANALAAAHCSMGNATYGQSLCFTHYMTAGGVIATTFKVRVGPDSGAASYVNSIGAGGAVFGGVCSSSITITEIKV